VTLIARDIILRRLLFKLFRIEEGLEKDAEDITSLVTSLDCVNRKTDGTKI